MRARRADRREIVAEPHEEHGLTAGVAENLLARREAARVDAGAEIGTAELLFGGHGRGMRSARCGMRDAGCASRKLVVS
jgi:hypothetical protein